MQPDEKQTPAVISVPEYAAATGQSAAAVRQQIAAGTCPCEVVVLRRPAGEGGRPRYGITRASVDRLLGLEVTP